jgi:hypothetical protein
MEDVAMIAILLGFFALAIGLVRVLGRMLDGDQHHGQDQDPRGRE